MNFKGCVALFVLKEVDNHQLKMLLLLILLPFLPARNYYDVTIHPLRLQEGPAHCHRVLETHGMLTTAWKNGCMMLRLVNGTRLEKNKLHYGDGLMTISTAENITVGTNILMIFVCFAFFLWVPVVFNIAS